MRRCRKIYILFGIIFSALVLTSCSSSNSKDTAHQSIDLSGHVVNSPLAGATVAIYNDTIDFLDDTGTDEAGFFSIDGLEESSFYLITAKGGTLDEQPYTGTLKGIFQASPCNITPLTTVAVVLSENQGLDYSEAVKQLMSWLGLAKDPFITAFEGNPNKGAPLAAVREAIMAQGLDEWVNAMIGFFEEAASAKERGLGWFGTDPLAPDPEFRLAGVLTPLSGASVEVYDIYNTDEPLYTTTTNQKGAFEINPLSGFAGDALLHIIVSGGTATGSEGLEGGMPEGTEFKGRLHALVPVSDYNDGKFRVSILTDIAYRYTRNLIDTQHLIGELPEGIIMDRLAYLTDLLLSRDINNDGVIDARDLFFFDPQYEAHRNTLSFDFELFTQPVENDQSLIASYYSGDKDALLDHLDSIFGMILSLFPAMNMFSEMVEVTLVVTGEGRVSSNIGGFYYDTASDETRDHIQRAYFQRDADQSIIFTAEPTSATEVLNWSGCDPVPDAMNAYACDLSHNRLVSFDFGYRETQLRPDIVLIDLSAAKVSISDDQTLITVSPMPGDTEMADKLMNLRIDDIVVGSQGYGFLRRISNIESQEQGRYLLTTIDASLEEVIGQGSAHLTLQATHADVANSAQMAESPIMKAFPVAGQSPRETAISLDKMEIADGVRFIPPADPTDTNFRFIIGEPPVPEGMAKMALERGGEFVWTDPDNGVTVKLNGSVEVSIHFEWGIDFSWTGLQSFKFIPVIEASENLEVHFSGNTEMKESIDLATLTFKPITFFIGPVPVVIVPELNIVLGIDGEAEGVIEAGVTFTQRAQGGFLWTKNSGRFQEIKKLEYGSILKTPWIEAHAEIKPYIKPEAGMMIYGVTGPQIDMEVFLKLRGEIDGQLFDLFVCDGGIDIAAYWGIDTGFGWDLGHARKLTRLIGMGDGNLRFRIYKKKELIRSWNIGGDCKDISPYLLVTKGPTILGKQVQYGSNEIIRERIIFTNSGGSEMNWRISSWPSTDRISFNNDTSLTGTLNPDENYTIEIELDTMDMPVGLYLRLISLVNQSATSSEENGSRFIPVAINVLPEPLAAPVLLDAVLARNNYGDFLPTQVDLSWAWWMEPENAGFLDGFRIFMTTTPNDEYSWLLKDIITEPTARGQRIRGLQPSTTYYFAIQAYGSRAGVSESSNLVSITTGDVPDDIPEPPPVRYQPFPDTGQTKCYNDEQEIVCPASDEPFYGQDAQYQPRLPRSYTKLGHGGVELPADAAHVDGGGDWIMTRDNVTGLIWEIKTINNVSNIYSWDNAQDIFIAQLNEDQLGGFSDWRMPNVKELSSLINNGKHNPAIDEKWFFNTNSGYYWSSTDSPIDATSAWPVSFHLGYFISYNKSEKNFVRAVRGKQPAPKKLIDNQDGTVTDPNTGLMWQKETALGKYSWKEALAYAENLYLAEYYDWRLPSRNELKTLVDYTRNDPAIDPIFSEYTLSSYYWSSTTGKFSNSYARHGDFSRGHFYGTVKTERFSVRAVRAGHFASFDQ